MVQMEKLVTHCDMELMKMAMLRHEATFRQQVHELHRLYRVQKQLMMSGGLSRPPSELIGRRRHQIRRGRRALDLRLPADDYILVVGAGADNAAPPASRQEDGLELTLAVGGGGGGARRRSPPYRRAMPAAFRLQEGTAVAKQPQQLSPWLVQCLRLKMA